MEERYIGVVKWFNKKAGYGFITCLEKEYQNQDIFVHQTELQIENEYFKYLIPGEYVEFQINHLSQPSKHSISAVNITGILGNPLMLFYKRTKEQRIMIQKPFPI